MKTLLSVSIVMAMLSLQGCLAMIGGSYAISDAIAQATCKKEKARYNPETKQFEVVPPSCDEPGEDKEEASEEDEDVIKKE